MLAASIRTRTSSGPGVGTGTSSSTSPGSGPRFRTARIVSTAGRSCHAAPRPHRESGSQRLPAASTRLFGALLISSRWRLLSATGDRRRQRRAGSDRPVHGLELAAIRSACSRDLAKTTTSDCPVSSSRRVPPSKNAPGTPRTRDPLRAGLAATALASYEREIPATQRPDLDLRGRGAPRVASALRSRRRRTRRSSRCRRAARPRPAGDRRRSPALKSGNSSNARACSSVKLDLGEAPPAPAGPDRSASTSATRRAAKRSDPSATDRDAASPLRVVHLVELDEDGPAVRARRSRRRTA